MADTNASRQGYYLRQALYLLKNIHYITLATTSSDGAPWNTPMGFEHDSELHLYWVSDKAAVHSVNVRENNQVFAVLFDSTVKNPEDADGLYIQATAEEVQSSTEIASIGALFSMSDSTVKQLLEKEDRRLYRATPQKIWMNDAQIINGIFKKDYRVELDTSKLEEKLRMYEH